MAPMMIATTAPVGIANGQQDGFQDPISKQEISLS
jgi:hypothetical protein